MRARGSAPDVKELRRAAGEWLRKLREERGLSQRDLAKLVGIEYHTFISQLEMGRGRVRADRYKQWADALGVPPKVFVKTLLRYYDPVTYDMLFDDDGSNDEPEADAAR